MKLKFLLLIPFTLFLSLTQAQTEKPTYAGSVTYTSGGFGGFDYPLVQDSVVVYVKDNKEISFKVFGKNTGIKNSRILDIDFKSLVLLKKEEYQNIVAPDKTIPTGNYDVKFSYPTDSKSGSFYTVNVTHFGDGSTALLTVMSEDREHVRLNDLFVANLTKLK